MNDLERAEIRKEQKLAKQFKFTKMTKKIAFLPTTVRMGQLNEVHSLSNGDPYVDYRDKERLCAPDKSFKKDMSTWGINKTCDGGFF